MFSLGKHASFWRLAGLVALLSGMAISTIPAAAHDSIVTGSGGGAINGQLNGASIVQTPFNGNGNPCAKYTGPLVYDSVANSYEGTYAVTDPATNVTHAYAGPLTVHYGITDETYQNANGSFKAPATLAPPHYCKTPDDGPGWEFTSPVTGLKVSGTNSVTKKAVECDFDTIKYSRRGTTISITLRGDPSVAGYGCRFSSDSGVTWTPDRYLVHQAHVNEQTFVPPAPSTSTGSETYATCPPSACS